MHTSFLKAHQPLPDDDLLKEEEIQKYNEVREYFINNPDEDCIPLFLNSFGGKDGLGVYQLVEDVITMYEGEKVLPYLLESFDSPYEGVKYWGIQIASDFPDECLFDPLVKLFESEDEDIRMAVVTALEQLACNDMKAQEIMNVVKEQCKKEVDEDVKDLMEEVLSDIRCNLL